MSNSTFFGGCFTALVTLALGSHANAYEPPIGIPAPAFGIEQTHYMYAGQDGYSDAGNGPYTHYVDNTAGCTDSSNDNGSQELPRCTVPSTLSAGSVVEIHGGPYTSGNSKLLWQLNGTANQPVFIRGIDSDTRPEFTGKTVQLRGTYGIVEYIEVNKGDVEFPGPSDHIALRHSHIHHHPGTGSIVDNGDGTFIVIYNNEINNNGIIPSVKDRHGVYSGGGTHHVWILDNHIHHNSGDAIQFCHGCVGGGNGPASVFIGRNNMHDDEENAIDLKEFIGPVIISENSIRNYLPSAESNGDAIRINDEGAQGDVWLLYNNISNSSLGIEPSSSKAMVYIIGNVLHDIHRAAIGWDADYVINNTVYDVKDAIRSGETKSNIISNATSDAIGDEVTGCSHNLINGGQLQRSCSDTISGDPKFVFDTSNELIAIQSSSPAIGGAFGDHAVYDVFQSQFGINIRVDANGVHRPVGASWSIGAHEFMDSVRPKPPVGLTTSGQ